MSEWLTFDSSTSMLGVETMESKKIFCIMQVFSSIMSNLRQKNFDLQSLIEQHDIKRVES